jgi:nicotinamide-nucleotide amidase
MVVTFMNAVIISVGNELMLGQTVDTNAAWLSRELTALGITIKEHITVGDEVLAINECLHRAGEKAEVVLTTGGLGPTKDDLTRIALAQMLGGALRLHQPSLDRIKEFFAARGGTEMPKANQVQAMFPADCEVLENDLGTAPGIQAQVGQATGFFLPGVPQEMKHIFERQVKNKLQHLAAQKGVKGVIITRTLYTVGVGESKIADRLGHMMEPKRNPLINSTAGSGKVSLHITARSANEVEALCLIEPVEREIIRRLGDAVYGINGDGKLAGIVGQLLRENKKTLAAAESCTGGMLSEELTDIPGSSDYFKCGWVVYSNQAKVGLLEVEANVIEQFGAVSEPVARQLAGNARRIGQTDYGIGITGIAGPGGDSDDKPVGLVFIGVARGDEVSVNRYIFPGDRNMVRQRTVNTALDMLRRKLL